VDPTWAGDIITAAFMNYFVIEKKSIEKSARLASTLAATSVNCPAIEGFSMEAERRQIKRFIDPWD
jgi:sugar/nucleoside kinase (ribokinase family)